MWTHINLNLIYYTNIYIYTYIYILLSNNLKYILKSSVYF